MTSPLPPRLRDTRSIADRVRQDRQNLAQLYTGLMGGRMSALRPLGATALLGDIEDDVSEEPTDQIAGQNTDLAVAAADGTVTLNLTYEPMDGTLHVRWRGTDLTPSDWSLVGQTLTFTYSHIKAGDVLSAAYLYFPTDVPVPDIGNFSALLASLGPLAWWKQADTGSTMVDSAHGHDGTYANVVLGQGSLVPSEPDDRSTLWNGASSEATVPNAAWMNISKITLLAVVDQPTPSTQTIMARDTFPSSDCWNFRLRGTGQPEFVFWTTTGGPYPLGGSLIVPRRSLVGVTYDGATARMYVNGTPGATLAQAGSLQVGSAPLTVGYAANGSFGTHVDHWQGQLQHLAIFDRDLTAANFADLATAGGF